MCCRSTVFVLLMFCLLYYNGKCVAEAQCLLYYFFSFIVYLCFCSIEMLTVLQEHSVVLQQVAVLREHSVLLIFVCSITMVNVLQEHSVLLIFCLLHYNGKCVAGAQCCSTASCCVAGAAGVVPTIAARGDPVSARRWDVWATLQQSQLVDDSLHVWFCLKIMPILKC